MGAAAAGDAVDELKHSLSSKMVFKYQEYFLAQDLLSTCATLTLD